MPCPELRLGNDEKNIKNGADVSAFVTLMDRRRPDVIGISGFSPDTRTLYKDLQGIIEHYNIQLQWDEEDGTQLSEKHEGIMINDELTVQNEMLGILEGDVDRHQAKLDVAKRRIGKIS